MKAQDTDTHVHTTLQLSQKCGILCT